MNQKRTTKNKGFTLIEILVVIGIIAILAAIVIIAINPARQFAQARNAQRTANVNAILNAVGQRIADNKGIFNGPVGSTSQDCPQLPTNTVVRDVLDNGSETLNAGDIDLSCLVPTYIPALPKDPKVTSGNNTDYDLVIESSGRVKISAPNAELGETIEVTR